MKFTVAIPTYGRDSVLTASIADLLALDPPPWELLVVDQTHRHDAATEERLSRWHDEGRIRWLRLERPSITGAMNRALLEARGDRILFLDDDIRPDPHLLRSHQRAGERDPEAIVAGRVLQLNVRPGEFVGAPPGQPLVILGDIERLHVRVDIDEYDIARFNPAAKASAVPRGSLQTRYPLQFIRVEPFVVPKKSLTGETTERVDTRVLQVIYACEPSGLPPLYVGQQVEAYIDAAQPASAQATP